MKTKQNKKKGSLDGAFDQETTAHFYHCDPTCFNACKYPSSQMNLFKADSHQGYFFNWVVVDK